MIFKIIKYFRWQCAKRTLKPILEEMAEYSVNLRKSSEFYPNFREQQIVAIEKADCLDAHITEIKLAFGCISFDKHHKVINHYY